MVVATNSFDLVDEAEAVSKVILGGIWSSFGLSSPGNVPR
jgi:hypothetical protein